MVTHSEIIETLRKAQTRQLSACPVCSDRGWEYFGGRFHFELRFEYWICPGCNLVGQSPAITEEALGVFYERYYRLLFQPELSVEEEFLFQQKRGRNLLECLRATDEAASYRRILDLGCAHGGLLTVARDVFQAAECVGVELDAAATAWSREQGLQVYATLEELEEAGLTDFDVATMSHVLEHLVDIEGALRYLKTFIKEEGYLCIEVPHSCEGGCFQLAHLWGFNESSLAQLIAKCGLRLVHMTTHGYPRVPKREHSYLVAIAQKSPKPTTLHFSSTPHRERMRRYIHMNTATQRQYQVRLLKNAIKQVLGRQRDLVAHSFFPTKLPG